MSKSEEGKFQYTEPRRHAVRFSNKDQFVQALRALSVLEQQGAQVDYSLVGGRALLLSERSFKELTSILDEQNVNYNEVKATPLTDLPRGEQVAVRKGQVFLKGSK